MLGVMKTVPIPSRTSIRATIATLMRDGEASLPHVAQRLGLSRRTLQRQLSDLDTSFSELVAEVRLDTACHLLSKSDLSLATIANRLGYRGPSSFSRSFMRLMKIQPAVYRRQQMAGLHGERHKANKRCAVKADAAL
jgi:AraC-like DNA-binding protein